MKLLLTLIVTGCLLVACSKQVDVSKKLIDESLQVLEMQSNKPIEGATVTARTCNASGWFGGCSNYTTVAITTTNASGIAMFSFEPGKAPELSISKYKYWPTKAIASQQTCFIYPEAVLKAHIKRVQTYAAPESFGLFIERDTTRLLTSFYIPIYSELGLPKDTTVYIKGWGFSDNFIFCRVGEPYQYQTPVKFESVQKVYMNGHDTLNVSIEY